MRAHKIWIEQCQAARAIRERFGPTSALNYLIAEKLIGFAAQAERRREFLRELPHFKAAVWTVFESHEIDDYSVGFTSPLRETTVRLQWQIVSFSKQPQTAETIGRGDRI